MAQKAVETVIDILKQKLPAPIATHLDAFLAGDMPGATNDIGSEAGEIVKGAIGSFFQRK